MWFFYVWLFLQIPVVLRCLSSEQNLSNFSMIFFLVEIHLSYKVHFDFFISKVAQVRDTSNIWPLISMHSSIIYSKIKLKVRKNRNDFMKTALLPKSNAIILRNSALSYSFYSKVYIFWEGHKLLRNLHLTLDCHYIGQN